MYELILLLFLVGDDYFDVFETFTLTPSVTRQCFNVSINDDNIFELTEYFNASLDFNEPLPTGASPGITNAQVRLLDNEGMYQFPQNIF